MTSVITVSFNSYRSLQRLRASLQRYTKGPWEWILVDNGSTRPETHRELAEISAAGEATVILNGRNLWFTRGCNIGLEKAVGDELLLLNPDIEVREGWLEGLRASLRRPRVGLVGCVLVDERGRVVHAGGVGAGDHLGEGRIYDPGASWAASRLHEGFVTGACMLFTRAALDAAGGALDERQRHYHSDRVFADRVRAAGLRVWMSNVVLVHSRGGSGL